MRFNLCTGCDRKLPPWLTLCPGCRDNGGRPVDPYADVAEAYEAETSSERVRVKPTPKRMTDSSPSFGAGVRADSQRGVDAWDQRWS